MRVFVRTWRCGISEIWWAVLRGTLGSPAPFDLCSMQSTTGVTRMCKAQRCGKKTGAKEEKMRVYHEGASETEERETHREREGERGDKREKDGRGGTKLAMDICCLSVPSPTGSGSPRTRCTAAAVATLALSNTNTIALLSQTKL